MKQWNVVRLSLSAKLPRLSIHLQQHVVNEVIVKTLCSRRHCPLWRKLDSLSRIHPLCHSERFLRKFREALFVTVGFLLFHASASRWPKIEQPKVENIFFCSDCHNDPFWQPGASVLDGPSFPYFPNPFRPGEFMDKKRIWSFYT